MRKKSTVRVDRNTGKVRESHWVTPSWQFELLLWDISSGFPLANHFGLPGSESLFDISLDPPICACISYTGRILPKRPMGSLASVSITPFWLPRSFSAHVWSGRSPDFENEKYAGPASYLNSLATLVLAFWSIGNVSPITLPWWGPSTSYLSMKRKLNCEKPALFTEESSQATEEEKGVSFLGNWIHPDLCGSNPDTPGRGCPGVCAHSPPVSGRRRVSSVRVEQSLSTPTTWGKKKVWVIFPFKTRQDTQFGQGVSRIGVCVCVC